MTAGVTLENGQAVSLPTLTGYTITHTDGDPCGCFEASFVADAQWQNALQSATIIKLFEDGKTMFTGVVDEVTFQLSSKGFTGQIFGRDLCGRLLDNQVRGAEFWSAQWEDIFIAYIKPFGIFKTATDNLPAVQRFSVDSGESCWRIVEGFCRHSAGVRPRFLPDGTLDIRRNYKGKTFAIDGKTALADLRLTQSFCEELSAVTEVDLSRKTVVTTKNDDWTDRNRRHEQVVLRTGRTMAADWQTAPQRIAESRREWLHLIVTVAGKTEAMPRDFVAVTLPNIGVLGTFSVTEVTSTSNDRGEFHTLHLRRNT